MSLRDKEGLNSFHVYPSEIFEFCTISMYYITYRLTEAVRLHCLRISVHLLRFAKYFSSYISQFILIQLTSRPPDLFKCFLYLKKKR